MALKVTTQAVCGAREWEFTTKDTESTKKKVSSFRKEGAFTLIEIVIVICIIAVMSALFASRVGIFSYWREEGFIRKLSETISFLHHQAVVDQTFYRIEFDFEKNIYTVGAMREEEVAYDENPISGNSEVGYLSAELAMLLSPAVGSGYSLIPPPSFPSLANPIPLPPDCLITDINTMRGLIDAREEPSAYILFSPRGFSEFAVIHLRLSSGNEVTILVNPFTGLTEIFRERREFEWTYNQKDDS